MSDSISVEEFWDDAWEETVAITKEPSISVDNLASTDNSTPPNPGTPEGTHPAEPLDLSVTSLTPESDVSVPLDPITTPSPEDNSRLESSVRPDMDTSGLNLREVLSTGEIIWEFRTENVGDQDSNPAPVQPVATSEEPRLGPQISVPNKDTHFLDL